MRDPTVSAAGMRIVKLLVGTPPQTVTSLMEAAGVTRTAVTEQLNELVAAGLVHRGTERLPGRGRPRHLYSATDTAMLLLFGHNQRLVAPAIWRAIEELGGPQFCRKVLAQVAHSLAEHYKQRITAKEPKRRLRQMIKVLCDEGGLVEATEKDGRLVMRKRSCPFASMVDEKRSICWVDLEMISEVVGRRVRRTACRHDGDPCCVFELVSESDR